MRANMVDANRSVRQIVNQLFPAGQPSSLTDAQNTAAVEFIQSGTKQEHEALAEAIRRENELSQRVQRMLLSAGSASIPVLSIAATRDDRHVVEFALRTLSELGESALPVLSNIAENEDLSVRKRAGATRALGGMGAPALDLLCTLSRDGQASVREAAANSLAQICEIAQALAHLKMLAEDDEVNVRRAAVVALRHCGSDAVEVLEPSLADEDVSVRLSAVDSLKTIGADAVPFLSRSARSEADERVRQETFDALSHIGVEALESLKALSRDTNPQTRQGAVRALRSSGTNALNPLIKAILDENESVRIEALMSLTRIGPAALPYLREALQAENRDVQQAIIRNLRYLGEDAIPLLEEALELLDPKVRLSACHALGGMGKPALPSLGKALEHDAPKIREQAIENIKHQGKSAIPFLKVALRNSYTDIRSRAVWELASLGPDATEALAEGISSPFDETRINSIHGLRDIGAPAAPFLIDALRNDDPDVVFAAINALSSIEQRVPVTELSRLFGNNHRAVRKAAVRHLQFTGIDSSMAPPLMDALESQYGDVSEGVIDVLADDSTIVTEVAEIADIIVSELIERRNRNPNGFNSSYAAQSLKCLIDRSPALKGQIIGRLVTIAFQDARTQARVVSVARNIAPQEFPQLVKERGEQNPASAARVMRLFGGPEAANFLSEQQAQALEHFRKPLEDLETRGTDRWEELSRQTKWAFYGALGMSVIRFVASIGVAGVGIYLIFASEQLGIMIGGTVMSVAGVFAGIIDKGWRDPVEYIRKYSAQQARHEAAFIGFMNQISAIRLILESEYMRSDMSIDRLSRYQELLSKASAQAAAELKEIER